MSITKWLNSFLTKPNGPGQLNPRQIKPISLRDWPRFTYTNCFGFAIGYSEYLEFYEVEIFNMDKTLGIKEAFCTKIEELGYNLPRCINEISEANSDEYVLAVFGFVNYQEKTLFGKEIDVPDYHLMRRELDGTWVHKMGWYQEPRVVNSNDARIILDVFGADKVVLFAFQAPSK